MAGAGGAEASNSDQEWVKPENCNCDCCNSNNEGGGGDNSTGYETGKEPGEGGIEMGGGEESPGGEGGNVYASANESEVPIRPVYNGSGGIENVYTGGNQGAGGTESDNNQKIKDELTNDCFRNTLNQMKNSNFDNEVQKILQKFNKSTNLNFTIRNEYMSSATRYANTVGNVITLNDNALGNASKELTARVIMHEMLHVYISDTESNDHKKMTDDYVTPMASELQSLFNMNESDAKALAWGGLGETSAYNTLSYNDKLNVYTTTQNHKNYNNEKQGQFGTKCD